MVSRSLLWLNIFVSLFLFGFQFIANTSYRCNRNLPVSRIELFPQQLHIGINVVGAYIRLNTPDSVQNNISGHYNANILHQQIKNLEFPWRQLDYLVVFL